jgi:hypothetical protein
MSNWFLCTNNDQTTIDTMNGYSGTATIVYNGGSYLYWNWTDANDDDVQAVQGSSKNNPPSIFTYTMSYAEWM